MKNYESKINNGHTKSLLNNKSNMAYSILNNTQYQRMSLFATGIKVLIV